MHLLPTFGGSVEKRLLQEAGVVGDYLLFYTAGAQPVARQADFRGHVEDEQAAIVTRLARLSAQPAASIGTQRRAIGDGETAQVHTFLDDIVEEVKRVAVELLVVFVITDHGTAGIRRDDAGGRKALRGKGAFARTCRAAEYQQRSPWNDNVNRRDPL